MKHIKINKFNYAFTLVELLAVIVILAIVLAIAIPSITGIINNTYNKTYELNEKMMIKAAKNYVIADESVLPSLVNEEAIVDLSVLVAGKYISNISDAKDKTVNCTGEVVITKTDDTTYTYTPKLACGNNYTTTGFVSTPQNANIHQTSVPSGYTGIYKLEDLYNIRNNLSGNYILMNNLNFNNDSDYTTIANKTTYTTGTGWLPIGDSTTKFTGTFDGNSYIISNLYLNRPTSYNLGLFGVLNTNSKILKLGLENVNISGSSQIGALAGQVNSSEISDVYSTGTVSLTATGSSYAGGLIGYCNATTPAIVINRSYSTATVSGPSYIGGLIGYIYYGTMIKDSFATGNVTATTQYVGGVTGYLGSGSMVNTFRNTNATIIGTNSNTYGSAMHIDYFKSELFLQYNLHFDTTNIWTAVGDTYPTLGGTTRINAGVQYNIYKIEDLYSIRGNLAGTYNLMNDLDFNVDSDYRNVSNKKMMTQNWGWGPIRNGATNFSGIFNGNSNKISNLYINRPTEVNVGLFATLITNSKVSQLGLENVNITGASQTGTLAGQVNSSEISDIYATGTVGATSAGTSYLGGLIGYCNAATPAIVVNKCYSTATVTAANYVGGLIGYLSLGSVVNDSFAAGNVTATTQYVGGLTGKTNSGSVVNSYKSNTAVITGTTVSDAGTSTTPNSLQNLTDLSNWNITTLWQKHSGAYPTFK